LRQGNLWMIKDQSGEPSLVVTEKHNVEDAIRVYKEVFGDHMEVSEVTYSGYVNAIELKK
jgi:antirestriction protein